MPHSSRGIHDLQMSVSASELFNVKVKCNRFMNCLITNDMNVQVCSEQSEGTLLVPTPNNKFYNLSVMPVTE